MNRVRECREGIANFSDRTLVLQFNYTTREERTGFDAFHHYFASRNRYAMVSTTGCRIYKEFYLIPLNYDQPAPQVILPLRGPGKINLVCLICCLLINDFCLKEFNVANMKRFFLAISFPMPGDQDIITRIIKLLIVLLCLVIMKKIMWYVLTLFAKNVF